MSIRSVFLDFYNTLCAFDPSREERQAIAWKQFSIDVPVDTIRRAYIPGDRYWTIRNALKPVQQLPKEEWDSFTTEYEQYLLQEAGVEVPKDLAREIYQAYSSQKKGLKLFHDIEPSLSAMKEAGLDLGVISNSDTDVTPMVRDLGVAGYFSFILSSCDVGCEKPHAPIFELALARAGVRPDQAVHVGDQYGSDVVGARAVGITPLLLDRFGLMVDQDDCHRIKGFDELIAYLGLPLWKSEDLLVSAI
ncbi:MAG: HAD-IA family hydrolase [Dehalococcoidia bacterium]|nr:HAD-IA family hydrolase [Dehalococcoidia bacterium]